MKSFKSLVTTKTFADLVYEDYVQSHLTPVKKPEIHLSLVRNDAENTFANLRLNPALSFSIMDANQVLNHEQSEENTHNPYPITESLSSHISQLKMLDSLNSFVQQSLKSNIINFDD